MLGEILEKTSPSSTLEYRDLAPDTLEERDKERINKEISLLEETKVTTELVPKDKSQILVPTKKTSATVTARSPGSPVVVV